VRIKPCQQDQIRNRQALTGAAKINLQRQAKGENSKEQGDTRQHKLATQAIESTKLLKIELGNQAGQLNSQIRITSQLTARATRESKAHGYSLASPVPIGTSVPRRINQIAK
jgi:hypothetical protein